MDLDWLPDLTAWTPADWGAASGVGTLAVAAVATFIARRQLKQARALREEEAAPFVVVDVVPSQTSNWILDLVIENVGKTVARDVMIKFDPPVESTIDDGDWKLAEWSPLQDGVRTMVPGRRLRCMFDSAHQRHARDLPRKYQVTVRSRDSRGREQPDILYTIDLEPLYSAMSTDSRGMHQLVGEVQKLREAVAPIAKKTLTVEVFDGPTRQTERAQRHAQWQRDVRAFEDSQGLPHSEPDPDAPVQDPETPDAGSE